MNTAVTVACPACGYQQVAGAERCARCATEFRVPSLFALRADDFEREVRNAAKPVVVHYGCPDCTPCRILAPVFAQAAAYRPQLRFASCNLDNEPALGASEDIVNLPTLILYVQGCERARISGTMRLAALLDWLDVHLAPAASAH